MDKFIFLDIDGVLNTANYQTWRQLWGKDISDLHGHLSNVEYLEEISDKVFLSYEIKSKPKTIYLPFYCSYVADCKAVLYADY